jgi:hypothetical protein
MLKAVVVVIGLLLLSGCAQERCDGTIYDGAAVRIAKEYFLARSIEKLERGNAADRGEARRMRKAGMNEETYRDTFARALFGKARRVGGVMCDHPLIYFDVSKSLAYGGFDVYFYRVFPAANNRDWRKIVVGVNMNRPGFVGGSRS